MSLRSVVKKDVVGSPLEPLARWAY
jgi:hypothetical protein